MVQNDYVEESKFTGGAFSNFFHNWVAKIVTFMTLYLAYPAMVCWKQRWVARHTYINGRQLEFDGKGIQLFGKFIVWWILSIITFGIYYIVCAKLAFTKWCTKHTHVATGRLVNEETSTSKFTGRWYQLYFINLFANLVTFCTLFIGYYWAVCFKNRWYCKHTIIDGHIQRFDGKAIQFFGKTILWVFLTVITFGIFYFWLAIGLKKWVVHHTKVVDNWEGKGQASDEYYQKKYAIPSNFTGGIFANFYHELAVIVVSLITFLLAYPAMVCWKQRWVASNTYINGKQLQFNGSCKQIYKEYILWWPLNFLLPVYGFIIVKTFIMQWYIRNTHIVGSNIINEEESNSNFTGKWYALIGFYILECWSIGYTLFIGCFWVCCAKNRWYCKNTTIDGHNLEFNGEGAELFKKSILGAFLTIITLGVYYPWFLIGVKKWVVNHTNFIDSELEAEVTSSNNKITSSN